MMQTLVGHTSAELTELLTSKGLPGYRGKQLGKGLYTRFLRDFEGFTDLPKALREQLSQEFTLAPCTERSIQSAPDGTEKYLLNLPDDEVIEAFRGRADTAGRGYQTMITEALREHLGRSAERVDADTIRRIVREELRKTG